MWVGGLVGVAGLVWCILPVHVGLWKRISGMRFPCCVSKVRQRLGQRCEQKRTDPRMETASYRYPVHVFGVCPFMQEFCGG